MQATTDINETLRDAEFKDDSPLKTVERIRKILRDNGMEAQEHWSDSGVPYCYSLRVSIRDTAFSVNGKGLTREFALASGYGELMERLQLGYIRRGSDQKSGVDPVSITTVEHVPAETLLQRNRPWYESYARRLKFFTGVTLSPEEILRKFTDGDGTVAATPFFCANTHTKEYIPAALRQSIYTTNGCAAGNTAEEAIVQAISEIVEREYKTRILTEDISVPEIPDSALQQYPVAYGIITYLRNHGIEVLVKDCSLGAKFPVVCVCFIDKATGKYHDHFGAYPIFEIALERALTESFQGRSIHGFAIYDDFIYASDFPLSELTVEFVKGDSRKKPGFFLGQAAGQWNEACGFSGKDNGQLLKECLEFFALQGCDVLIRDCSCLGFPTYQVLIPGYSEIFVHRLSPKHNEYQHGHSVAKVLRYPTKAKLDEILSLLTYISRNKSADKRLAAIQFTKMAQLAADITPEEDTKLLAAAMGCVFYTMGQMGTVLEYIQKMLPLCQPQEQEYLICLKRYLSMQQHQYDEGQTRALLELFHKPETVQALYACLAENRNPMERFTLHCGAQCPEDCPLRSSCCTRHMNQLANMIDGKMSTMDFDASAALLQKIL